MTPEEERQSAQNTSSSPERDNTNVDSEARERQRSLGKAHPSSGGAAAILPGIDPNIPKTPLKEKYEFLTVLGAGGAGVIYKAKQHPLGRLVAVKMVHSHLMSGTSLKRFQQEAKTISTLAHPNIIAVYDFGISDENQPFMVMDYVEGTVLSEILNDVGSLPATMVKTIAIQLCDGLSHAHMRGVLHRDLKPSNIMLVQMETGQQLVKILDFGLAKVLFGEEEETEHLTKTGETVGTPAFMSPEQVMGKQLDHRSDLYSLGCVMYHCLTGDPPFVGETKMETMLAHLNSQPEPINIPGCEPKVSAYLEAIVMKLLQKHPSDRFQSMWDLKEALEGQEQLVMPAGGWSFDRDDDDDEEDEEEDDQGDSLGDSVSAALSTPQAPVATPSVSTYESHPAGQEASLETIILEGPDSDKRSNRRWLLIVVSMLFFTGIMASLVLSSFQHNQNTGSDRTPETHKSKKKKTIVRGSGEDPFDERLFSDQELKRRINDNRFVRNLHTSEAITDDALIPAAGMPNLAELDLDKTPVTEKVLMPLRGKESLSHLRLSNTRVGDDVVKYLATFPNLQAIDLSNDRLITDGFMAGLSKMPALQYLKLNGDQISDHSMDALLSLKSLNELYLGDTQVSDLAMDKISQLQTIQTLDLSNTRLTDEGARRLAELKRLEHINLAGTNITDQTVRVLAALPNIKSIDVSRTKVTDRAIPEFRKMKGLNRLRLIDCNISRAAINSFQREMEGCALEMTPENDEVFNEP